MSRTRIALHVNGDLVLDISTVHDILLINPPALEQASLIINTRGHSIQIGPSQSNVVRVDGQPIIAGACPTTVSSIYIALHANGDLILGTSTIHNIPAVPPAPQSYFTLAAKPSPFHPPTSSPPAPPTQPETQASQSVRPSFLSAHQFCTL